MDPRRGRPRPPSASPIFAQGQLGDVVFVEVPSKGAQLQKGKEAAVVEGR
jgi:glycine cleavage system H lipoate-binding protein